VLLAACVSVALALVVHTIGAAVVLRLTRSMPVMAKVAEQCRSPVQVLLPLIALQAVWHGAPDTFPLISGVRHANGLLLLAALTWAGMRAARGAAMGVISLHPVDVEDNLNARRIHTQTRMLARTAMFIVLLTGLALMLMTFPGARQFGASLLASAGVAGLVIGMAARPVFSNLIAGLQLALAQPIRLDDVLIVQGEWGRVEEITGTYVVLKIWDERRLIIPLQWFIENPFENWTRTGSEILGTVFLFVDYTAAVEAIRAEARRIVEAAPEWDKRVFSVQVTDATDRSMQVRVLVSARDAGKCFDLRCKVRERLIAFLAREYPEALPKIRVPQAEAQAS
jgi:small-conductance mechanosensitive channel